MCAQNKLGRSHGRFSCESFLVKFSSFFVWYFSDVFFAGADGLTKNIDEVASVDDVRRSIEIGRATRIFSVTIQGELLLRGL